MTGVTRRLRRPACATLLGLVGIAGVMLQAHAQELRPWRHAIIEAKSDAGFALMVKEGGFAAKRGLNLEITQVKSDQIGLKALLAGQLESYEGGPAGAILASARGADLKILGCHWPSLVHGLFVRAEIASVPDLKGRNIAISAPGAMPDLLARAVLEKYGLSAKDIRFANLGSDLDRYKALSAGVVDAAIISTEYVPVAPGSIKLLIPGREILPNFLRVCIVTGAKVLSERADDAARFIAAEIEALRYAVSHRDREIELTRTVTKIKPDDPRPGFIFDEAIRHHDIDPEIGLAVEKLEWTKEMLAKSGNLPQGVDVGRLIDPSVHAAALELIGR